MNRTIVSLNASLEVFLPDGFSRGEYPEVTGLGTCWSDDETKLVDTMMERPSRRATLEVLDLGSKRIHAIAINVDQKEYLASQCWSPDAKRLVYQMDNAVRLYSRTSVSTNAFNLDSAWSHWSDQSSSCSVARPNGFGSNLKRLSRPDRALCMIPTFSRTRRCLAIAWRVN